MGLGYPHCQSKLWNVGLFMKKAILLVSILSLLVFGCQSVPAIQYIYQPPENINDGLEVAEIEGDLLKAVIAKNLGKIEEKYEKLIKAQSLLNKAVTEQMK